jgi:hypothetical protein
VSECVCEEEVEVEAEAAMVLLLLDAVALIKVDFTSIHKLCYRETVSEGVSNGRVESGVRE